MIGFKAILFSPFLPFSKFSIINVNKEKFHYKHYVHSHLILLYFPDVAF